MKSTNLLILPFFFIMAVSALQARAQSSNDGWQPGGEYDRLFDSSKMETLEGEIARIDTTRPMRDMQPGRVLQFAIDGGGNITVDLGPEWYINTRELILRNGDRARITGSIITAEGKTRMLASEISSNGKTLVLRDKSGMPAWSGMMEKHGQTTGNKPEKKHAPKTDDKRVTNR